MAYARIISGGADGRYTVELDYGDSLRLTALAATTARISQIETQIAQVQVKLNEAEAREAAQRAYIESIAATLISGATRPNPGGFGVNSLPLTVEQRKLGMLLAANQPIRDQMAALKFELANWRRKAAHWNTLQTKVQKPAWCVDYTTDIPALAYTATCDIPGDPNLVLIAAGGRAWQASDGEFRARELLSPAQCYFNAAIFPGWQKFKPTYRWGTATAINYDADTMTVALFAQTSSAQRLSVNQASTLTNVPVVYMTCNASAFRVGDRVVVQFLGQNWTNPRVIGFLDNPKPCIAWPDVSITVSFTSTPSGTSSTRSWINQVFETVCGTSATGGLLQTIIPAVISGGYGAASFANPSEAVGFSLSSTIPDPVTVGTATVRSDGASGEVPAGSSPGVGYVFDNPSPESFRVRTRSFPFSTVSYPQYDTTGGGCTEIGSVSGSYYTLQPVGMTLNEAAGLIYSESTTYSGTVTGYFGTPSISVTKDGITKVYTVKSVSGMTVTFGAPT